MFLVADIRPGVLLPWRRCNPANLRQADPVSVLGLAAFYLRDVLYEDNTPLIRVRLPLANFQRLRRISNRRPIGFTLYRPVSRVSPHPVPYGAPPRPP